MRHRCESHQRGAHTDHCLHGPCGFCGTSLDEIASGECRACQRIVCEACDEDYTLEHGALCRDCFNDTTGGET